MSAEANKDVNVDELFELMQKNATYGELSCVLPESDSTMELSCAYGVVPTTQRVTRMSNGNFHVCLGMACPYKIQSFDNDRHYVCSLTGMSMGYTMEAPQDSSWTGRSCSSADPDMTSGAVKSRVWRTKRDAFNDSVRAYGRCASISIDEPITDCLEEARDEVSLAQRHQCKSENLRKGAPCIGEIDEKAVANYRFKKAQKRAQTLESVDVITRLKNDACHVARKLLSTLEGVSMLVNNHQIHRDKRLESYDFVLSVGIRRYIARCKDLAEAVQLSAIHDICVASNTFVKARRKEAESLLKSRRIKNIATDCRTIELCASLIVACWNAVCITSHFMQHQSGDSFKPFAAGIMYAFKRGLYLPNGVMLVPQLEDLSEQLPVLRSLVASSAAKHLHASSHRGLCAIHKAISSIDSMESESKQKVLTRVSIASTIARELQTHVRKLEI